MGPNMRASNILFVAILALLALFCVSLATADVVCTDVKDQSTCLASTENGVACAWVRTSPPNPIIASPNPCSSSRTTIHCPFLQSSVVRVQGRPVALLQPAAVQEAPACRLRVQLE